MRPGQGGARGPQPGLRLGGSHWLLPVALGVRGWSKAGPRDQFPLLARKGLAGGSQSERGQQVAVCRGRQGNPREDAVTDSLLGALGG